MATAFGAPSGGIFGSPLAASSPAPAFGAASPFGPANAPATTSAFSFSGAAATGSSLFGASSAPAFGAASSPGLFGANSSPGFFGASSASAFGASSASAFGTSSPGLFGANSSPGLFGANSSPSLFGSSSPSLFGASAAAPSTGFNLFGGSSSPSMFSGAAASTGGSFFGASQMAPSSFSNPAVAFPGAAAQPASVSDSAAKEVREIRAAYDPNTTSYKFQHLFLNVVGDQAQRYKPANIDEMRWRQCLASAGGPDNPDRLWPVAANGFQDLLKRSQAQVEALEANNERLKNLKDLAHKIAQRHGGEFKQRLENIEKQHVELSARLLRTCRTIDALESRLAVTSGYRNDVARQREEQISQQLIAVEVELAPGAVTGLSRRLDAVRRASELRVNNPVAVAAAQAVRLDDRSSQQLMSVLKDHGEAIAKLQAVLKRDALDVAIMGNELRRNNQNGGMLMD